MRKKSPKLVITFDTTAAVMALESACAGQERLGRIIPTPQQISAGCGLSWCAPPEQETTLLQLCRDQGIPYAAKALIEMYG